MFPDVYSGQPGKKNSEDISRVVEKIKLISLRLKIFPLGSSVGIVITDDNVYNIDGEAHALLAQLLTELTALQRDTPLSEDQVM